MTKPPTPPLADIAAWCGVRLVTVRQWSRGARPAPGWAIVRIADHVGDDAAMAILRFWTSRWRALQAAE